MAPRGRLAAAWGVLGVAALLVEAIVRLSVHVWTAVSVHPLSAWQWTAAAAWGAAMLFFEGYRGFQRSFSPRVVARAYELARAPTLLTGLLAPLYCMGLGWATRRRLVAGWTLVALVVGLVLLAARLEQPLRGLFDLGVVLGLSYGLATLVALTVRALATGAPSGGTEAVPGG